MAYDIGPRIGIDGEAEFRKQLKAVSESIKTMGSEMKVVTTAFSGNENSMEALTSKNEVLSKTIEALNDKIKLQQKFLNDAKDKFGDNAEETQKWQRAVNESTAELNRLQNELRQNEKRLENFGQEAEDAGDSLDKTGGSMLKFGDALKASFVGNLASDVIGGLFSKLVELGGAIVNLDEETAEYRAEQAMLLASFEANGHGADTAKAAYSGLFRVIGDSDEATEASQLLGNLAGGAEDIDKWTRIAAGSWGKFGKALPITNLIEAANEAAKTGKRVSALDDVISWSGGDAEAFAKSLQKAKNEEERLALITDTLSGYLNEAADSFYANNEQVLQARDNQYLLNETMAEMGEAVGRVKTELGSDFVPLLADAGSAFADMLSETEGAEEKFANAIGNLVKKGGESVSDFIKVGGTALANILAGLTSKENLSSIGNSIVDILGSITDMLKENAGEIAVAAPLLLMKFGAGLLKAVGNALDDIPGIVQDIGEAFREHKDEFAELGKELGQAFIDAFKSMFKLLERLFEPYEEYNINWGPQVVPRAMPHKTGLNYVPYDGYLAELHKGEMVLTARQAEMMRSTGVTNGSMQNTGAALINALQTMGSGSFGDTPINISLMLPDGDALATWQLPSLLRVANAQGITLVAE